MNKKMADIDIDTFEEHESRSEEPTDEIFLLPQWEEDQLGNQHMNRKHHLEVEVVRVYFTKST